jgi:hypothetical protein
MEAEENKAGQAEESARLLDAEEGVPEASCSWSCCVAETI